MLKLIKYYLQCFLHIFNWRDRQAWSTKIAEDPPDHPVQHCIYAIGDRENYWCAFFICPCGCGENISLNLLAQVRPRWKLHIDQGKRPTLEPSIWRHSGCESHFFIKKGRVQWCVNKSQEDI